MATVLQQNHLQMRISNQKYVKQICVLNRSHKRVTKIHKCVTEVKNVKGESTNVTQVTNVE